MRHGIRWSRRHPVLGRVAGPVLDPTRGEALSVTMMGVLLVFVFWGLVMLLFLSPFSAQPQALDQAVMNFALALRNHLADPAMVAISQLSRWPVSVFSALALLLWLLGAGRRNAAIHWLIAIGGGAVLHLLLSWSLRTTPQVLEMAGQTVYSPSAAMSLSTVVLTFFAVMEAGELPRKHRQWPYLAAALILTLLALARLYLGMEWLSGALMGMVSGLAWTAIVGIAYRQRATRRFSGATASLIFYGSFLALFSWQVNEHLAEDLAALKSPTFLQQVSSEDWWDSGWKNLPMDRTQLSSVASRAFNAQIAADPREVSTLLEAYGWESVPSTDWRWIIQALNPEPDQASLPLLGRAFQGRSEVLLLKRELDEDGRLLTFRLWDSGFRLEPGGEVLYLGQLSEEVLVQRFGLFSYWRATSLGSNRFKPLQEPLKNLEQKLAEDKLLLIRSRQAD
jgi:membrane-associated phospholipid phosphatase